MSQLEILGRNYMNFKEFLSLNAWGLQPFIHYDSTLLPFKPINCNF